MIKYLIVLALIIVVGLIFYLRRTTNEVNNSEELFEDFDDISDITGSSASISLLLSTPYEFDEKTVRLALTKGLGSDFSEDSDDQFMMPMVEGTQYMIKSDDSMFILHNVSGGYFPDSNIVADTISGDDALAENIRAHKGWISFDVINSDLSMEKQFDLVGAVLAELAPEQTVALYFAEKSVLIRFDDERREQLKGPDAYKKLGF